MATLAQFAQNMRRYAQNVERNGPAVQRRVAMACLSTVVLGTPVGNPALWGSKPPPGYVGGRARANWQVGLAGPRTGTIDKVDPNGSATITGGRASIAQSTQGRDIHLTNNLPYIVPLNEGHSKQAPAGFVETAVRVGQGAVRGVSILVGKVPDAN